MIGQKARSAIQGTSRVVFYLVAVGLLVSSFQLLRKYRTLERDYRSPTEVPKGAHLDAIEGYSVDGVPRTLKLSKANSAKLVLISSIHCPICTRTWIAWGDVIRRLSGNRNVEVWLLDLSNSVDGDYLRSHHIEVDHALTRVTPGDLLRYRIRLVPQTLAMSPSGEVLGVWTGELGRDRIQQVMETFQHAQASR